MKPKNIYKIMMKKFKQMVLKNYSISKLKAKYMLFRIYKHLDYIYYTYMHTYK